MALSENGRRVLEQFKANTAKAWGGQVGNEFSATPTIEQTLIEKIVEHGGWFMAYITMLMVDQIKGQKVLMSVNGKTASRTQVSNTVVRKTNNLLGLDNIGYELFQTNNDINISYADIDAWAKFPNFANLYNALIKQAMADDLITIGWHGTSHAATTDIVAHPMLEDVNIGWLELIRLFNAGARHTVGTVQSPIAIGSTQYPSLDALVTDLKYGIPTHKRNNLICYMSDDLVGAAEGTYYAQNTDKAAEKLVIAQNQGTVLNTFGGLKTIVPPFFPEKTILIAPRNALQHYTQAGSIRRTIRDAPEKNGIDDFNSSNQGYVVADEDATFLAENITFAE